MAHPTSHNDTAGAYPDNLRSKFSIKKLAWLGLAGFILIFAFPITLVPGRVPAEIVHRVDASRYEYTPAVLRANHGDHVTIELVATDVVHGLFLDGYNLEVSADPGQTARLQFVADRSGSFRFRCSITCGPLHPFMIGKLVVAPNWLAWKALAAAFLAAGIGTWMVRR